MLERKKCSQFRMIIPTTGASVRRTNVLQEAVSSILRCVDTEHQLSFPSLTFTLPIIITLISLQRVHSILIRKSTNSTSISIRYDFKTVLSIQSKWSLFCINMKLSWKWSLCIFQRMSVPLAVRARFQINMLVQPMKLIGYDWIFQIDVVKVITNFIVTITISIG